MSGDAARLRFDDAPAGEPEEVLLPFADFAEAKLILTDELIEATLRDTKKRSRNTEIQNAVADQA